MTSHAPVASCKGNKLSTRINITVRRMKSTLANDTRKRDQVRRFYDMNICPVFDTFFRSPNSSTIPLTRNTVRWGNVSALYAATRTVDLIFFRGELIKYVDVTFAPLGPDRMAECGAVVFNGEHRSHIKLDLAKFHSEWSLLGTLTHEMIHAFIQHHTCRCVDQACAEGLKDIDEVGKSGHGGYFHTLANAAEELADRVWKDVQWSLYVKKDRAGTDELRWREEGEDEEGIRQYSRKVFGEKDGDRVFAAHFAKGAFVYDVQKSRQGGALSEL